MATKIVTKNSSTASAVPTASDLVQGELAVNVADKRLFTEDNAGAIVELGTNPSALTVTGNVGIGTSSPVVKLAVKSSQEQLTLSEGDSRGATFDYRSSTGNLNIATNGINARTNPQFTLDLNGNVGVGASSPSSFNYLSTSPHLVIGGGSSDAGVTCYSSTNGYGRLAFADGTNTTEQYRGLIQFYHGDNSMQFYTGSDERMRIDASGNLTTRQSTGNNFRVVRFGDNSVEVGNYNATDGYQNTSYLSSTHTFYAGTAGAESVSRAVDIDSSGRVGISTSDPKSALEVKGTFGAPATSGSAAGFISRFSQTSGVGSLDFGFGDPYSWIQSRASNNYATSFDLALQPNGGNVGIGVSNPSDYYTNFNDLVLGSTSTHSGMTIASGTTHDGTIAFADGTSGTAEYQGYVQYNHEVNTLTFGTAATTRMTIDSSGNLLVGKTSTDDGVNGFKVAPTGVVTSTVSSPSTNTYLVYSGGYKFYVNTDGGISNFSANNVNLSDEREKKNIELLESQWDSLKQWSLKKFHYNSDADSDNKKLGVIAQEVETHNPEVIDEFNVNDETTRMAVKEQQMMWMAIKALQEAQTRIETLEARVTELENN